MLGVALPHFVGDSKGQTIWIADSHRGDGKCFVVHVDETLTAFIELESVIRECHVFSLTVSAQLEVSKPAPRTALNNQ
jgi:hypothetical protein